MVKWFVAVLLVVNFAILGTAYGGWISWKIAILTVMGLTLAPTFIAFVVNALFDRVGSSTHNIVHHDPS